MYNEQIENLINAALADGVLTEKEKQVLFKRAQAMGIDLDEFEMVLDARLVELKKKEARENEQYQLEMEKAKAAQKSAPKSDKFGDVRKCPACGAMVESFQTKCPECGHEFSNIEANSTTQKLMAALDECNQQATNQGTVSSILSGVARISGLDSITARKTQIIQNFPVPNAKEDLIEMLVLAHSNVQAKNSSVDAMRLSGVWKAKEKQIRTKADIVLKNDPDYIALIESWNKKKWWKF